MPLSEEEQKLLDQMEAALAAEDPRLADTMRGTSRRIVHKRQATLAGVAFLAGVGLLIGGMMTHPVISVVGFVVMLVATIVALNSWQQVEHDEEQRPARDTSFMDKLDERRRRRMEDGF